MHIALSGVFSLIVTAAMVASAVAYRGRFRVYTVATLLVVIGFGAAASFATQGIEENLRQWAGGCERSNACAYFVWIVVLAVTMLRHRVDDFAENAARQEPERDSRPATAGHGSIHRLIRRPIGRLLSWCRSRGLCRFLTRAESVLGQRPSDGRQPSGGSSPVRPSTASRIRSACPVCRPYSSMRSHTSRRRLA